jgi:hypothetical protein
MKEILVRVYEGMKARRIGPVEYRNQKHNKGIGSKQAHDELMECLPRKLREWARFWLAIKR